MTATARRRILLTSIFGLPLALFFSILLFELAHPPFDPLAPLPNPDGYDDLVKAGQLVSEDSGNIESASAAQLREIVAANAGALALARAGLSNECRVPLQFTPAYNENHLTDLADAKRLARAFVAEGKLAELENHPAAAASSYLDTIRLGMESPRGGTVLDQMVGTAIEVIGTSQLQKLVADLDAKSARAAAITLETLDARRQTWEDVMRQENDWSRRTFAGIRYEMTRWMTRKSLKITYQKTEQKLQHEQLKTRQLIIDLATRVYTLEKGHPPASVSDLVPDYLKAIPRASFTGTNVVYSPQ